MDSRRWTDEKNLEWSSGLRRVSLVAELEVDDDDLDHAREVFGSVLRLNPAQEVARHHPAFLLVCLTATGMASWEEGTFYAKVAQALNCSKRSAEDVTRFFPECLDRFGLPRFDEAGGMRWVTPVLLHGGIPLDHLDELLDLVTSRRRRDPTVSGDSFVEWARLNSRALATQPKALVRFLQYGGEFAPDLVGRVLDYVDERDVVLPRGVRERLALLAAQGRVVRSADRREARPSFALHDDGVVVVRLPGVQPTGSSRDVEWRVHQGPLTETFRAVAPWTAGPRRTDPLTVEVHGPVRTVTVERDGAASELPLVQAEDPMLVFDADGELVPRTRAIPAGPVTLMWPGSVEDPPRDGLGNAFVGDDLDLPYGWERWARRETVVSPGTAVHWHQYPAHRVAGFDRARVIVESELEWVHAADGYNVTVQRPTVALPQRDRPEDWVVQVSTRDGVVLERTRATAHRVDLLRSQPRPLVADLVVSVKGPLGRGVTRRAVVAEGLEADSTPDHRGLVPPDGLAPAQVRLSRGDQLLHTVTFSPEQMSHDVQLEGLTLVVTPPHTALSWVDNDVPGPWTVQPVTLTAEQVRKAVIHVRGLPPGTRAVVTFTTGLLRHEVVPRHARGDACLFDLSALTDSVRQEGSGTLFLTAGGPPTRIGAIRPAQLATRIELEHDRLDVDLTVSETLELVVYRLGAPWEPGRVLALAEHRVALPADLRGRGPLRVQVRRVDEWTQASTASFPSLGADVFDVDQAWHADREDEGDEAVAAVLLGALDASASSPTPQGLAHALEALALPRLPYVLKTGSPRQGLAHLLSLHPPMSLEAVHRSTASTSQLTVALAESGLVHAPAVDTERPDLVEPLLARCPVAAMLSVSAAVERHGVTHPAAGLQAAALGDCLVDLWGGQPDDMRAGRFEPQFEERPELPKFAYDYLAPVPTVLLDADSRVAACYRMWQARAQLSNVAALAMPAIHRTRQALASDGLEAALWPYVQQRLSHDGVIALPALSIALALLARVAAHRDGAARQQAVRLGSVHADLARHAPDLVAIDLVRADAAVIGATR
ncbi:hypothetical protein [Cellulomonas sp. NTE-D12]|uniref:hypothetical protein n=1 Tax=Cellulomonas sp. NTE-D12 TaxID=2962632 RepID=UPI0030813C8C|nr:hypothetical protein CELD12_26410 [Cellulomonas sp. NTE-D12]